MRKRLALVFVLALPVAVAALVAYLASPMSVTPPTYKGRTAAQWEKELENWEYFDPESILTGRVITQPSRIADSPGTNATCDSDGKLLILTPDPDALPVLIELLCAHQPSARRTAVQGLEALGSAAWTSIPNLLAVLDDTDRGVRANARRVVWRIDPKAAAKAGVQRDKRGGYSRIKPVQWLPLEFCWRPDSQFFRWLQR